MSDQPMSDPPVSDPPASDPPVSDAAGRVPAVWLVIGGIASVQVGAAIAKNLFAVVPPTAMVWMRLATSAIVFLLLVVTTRASTNLRRRPGARGVWRGRRRRDWWVALAFGVALMTMNWAIYQSFARIPLGMAVTIEFLGPLTVALIGSRRGRDLAWVLLAAAGVALLGFDPVGLNPAGVLFALLAGAAWAAYILLSAQTGRRWPGITGLTVASLVGALVLAPVAVAEAGPVLLHPSVLVVGVAVGLLSSVIPYSLELSALRRIPARVFGVLMSLEPAAAAFAALILLREFLSPLQWVAVACVIAASIGVTRS